MTNTNLTDTEPQAGAWAEASIGLLHLPSAAARALKAIGIATVADFSALSDARLNRIPRLGEKNLAVIRHTQASLLQAAVDTGRIDWKLFREREGVKVIPADFGGKTSRQEIVGSLPNIIREVLEQNSDRRLWSIIQRRFELEGTEHLTLEELGLAFGLTRERVRQLEVRALDELKGVLLNDEYSGKSYEVHSLIRSTVAELSKGLIDGDGRAIRESELLNKIKEDFGVAPEQVKPSLRLLLSISGLSVLSFNTEHLEPIWTTLDASGQRYLQNVVERLDRTLTEGCALPLTEIDILIRLNKNTRQSQRVEMSELGELLSLCSSIESYGEGSYWGKFQHLRTRGNQAERVLFERGETMKVGAIAREINHRLARHGKKTVTERNLVNQMSGDNRFTPIGRSGEWGLSSWSIETGTIIELMKQCLVARNKPQTEEEIYVYVSERRPVTRGSITAYLTFEEDFAKVGRTKWGLSSWSEVREAIMWSPEQVGEFVEELFRSNRRRKLKYEIVRQALMNAANIKRRQAQGMLGVNPVIRTERDAAGELYAIFQQDYHEQLSRRGAAFRRKKKTLRQQVREVVLERLESAPGNQVALKDLVSDLVDHFHRPDKTFYQYISNIEEIEKFTVPDTNAVMVRLKRAESPLPFPVVDEIGTSEIRDNVSRALTFLTEADVDVALFLLSKEFEARLKAYLSAAHEKGEFRDLKTGELSLNYMVDYIKKNAIITDQAVLHFLRQQRNDRTHGSMPNPEERRLMFRHADVTASMYIDYIKFFDDLVRSLDYRQ